MELKDATFGLVVGGCGRNRRLRIRRGMRGPGSAARVRAG
jgi:hypothetical protein